MKECNLIPACVLNLLNPMDKPECIDSLLKLQTTLTNSILQGQSQSASRYSRSDWPINHLLQHKWQHPPDCYTKKFFSSRFQQTFAIDVFNTTWQLVLSVFRCKVDLGGKNVYGSSHCRLWFLISLTAGELTRISYVFSLLMHFLKT